MHTRVERSVSDPAVIRQRREKYRFEEERNGRRDYGEQEGAAPEENRIAEEYGGRYEAMRRCIVLMLGRS